MKKVIIFSAALIAFANGVNAQTQTNQSASASQTTNLVLSNAIEITFTGTGNATGADVNLPFTTVNDYANGVESSSQELKVRSNKNFSVNVKANASQFSYTGTTSPAPHMPVSSVLDLKVVANNTGGNVGNSYSTTAYKNITPGNGRTLLDNCDKGGNQTFSVKYKATPGFSYPAGTYSVDVVYTATQQ